MNNNTIIDIKEINDKGVHIIVIKTYIDFKIGKKKSRDYFMLKI